MNLPSDHKELEDFPEYALIQKWTGKFDIPGYEVDIKICSSGYAQPFWSEAVLFYNGRQLSCSGPESTLKDEWTLCGDNMEFVVSVEEADISLKTSCATCRIDALKEKAERIGAHFEHKFIDVEHLECF